MSDLDKAIEVVERQNEHHLRQMTESHDKQESRDHHTAAIVCADLADKLRALRHKTGGE